MVEVGVVPAADPAESRVVPAKPLASSPRLPVDSLTPSPFVRRLAAAVSALPAKAKRLDTGIALRLPAPIPDQAPIGAAPIPLAATGVRLPPSATAATAGVRAATACAGGRVGRRLTKASPSKAIGPAAKVDARRASATGRLAVPFAVHPTNAVTFAVPLLRRETNRPTDAPDKTCLVRSPKGAPFQAPLVLPHPRRPIVKTAVPRRLGATRVLPTSIATSRPPKTPILGALALKVQAA